MANANPISNNHNDNNKDAENKDLPFVCVHCSTPCSALYRRLSVSLASIKLMTCENCQRIVDPYIEREWLLVAIDCILHREEAYRHVLYNEQALKEISIKQAFQCVVVWSILDGYLKWETLRDIGKEDIVNADSLPDLASMVSLAMTSFIGVLVQWSALHLFLSSKLAMGQEKPSGCGLKLFWSLLLPSSFSVVVIFVLIWENTKTVRLLGSLFIAYWQQVAISVVSPGLGPPLLSLSVGTMWRLVASLLWLQPYPCVGLELEAAPGFKLCLT